MAKQLNVNLAFTADTTQARMQMQDLQKSLSQLITNSTKFDANSFGLTQEITDAIKKVTELQAILDNAQTKAGTLDLGKLNESLTKNSTNLKSYASAFSSLGAEGERAFAQLAKSITMAEIPLKRTNTLLTEFSTTLKNTARWQISSSILHGFMGSIQSAYGYAQDLNESLNNIRIVSGQSTEQMAAFAEEANKAAKALSSTTVAYTDAALIYYQQGLNEEQVKERTDITIKMANVTRDSVEEVSNQLTAVWNNFDDGTKSLEHYADVMTALGAATASSTDEIAGGLEKFASIADMIGLSFEYAASALATITATTRQSEDVVGTALKTIFARIQGLQLGETLDDGTTLNKYSEALDKVGISIFDQAGELKNMDSILDEMGQKWNTLSKDQQVALAQTVAGVRQYNQLVSLMDNWDYFQENLQVANSSAGALQEQADIYAESWEAAQKRVQAAMESIYSEILNDNFFIVLTNGFGSFLEILDNTIDTLGGLPGVLSVVSSLMFKIFGKDMVDSIERWSYNLQLGSKNGLEKILKQRTDINNSLKSMFINSADAGLVGAVKGDVYTQQANLQDTLIAKQQQLVHTGTQLTEQENKQAQLLLNINEQLGQSTIKITQNLEKQQQTSSELERQSKIYLNAQNKGNFNVNISETNELIDFNSAIKQAKNLSNEYGQLIALEKQLSKASNFNETVKQLELVSKQAKESGVSIAGLDDILEEVNNGTIKDFDSLKNSLDTLTMDTGARAQIIFDDIATSAEIAGVNMKEFTPILKQMQEAFTQTGTLTTQQIQALKDYGVNVDFVTEQLKNMSGQSPTAAQGIVSFGEALSSTAMTITTLKGLFDTWNNEDLSIGDKLISTFTSLSIIIPMVTNAFNQNSIAQMAALSKTLLLTVGLSGEAQAAVAAGTATASFGAALWTALWPIGLLMVAVAGLVAAVWGIVKVFEAVEASSPENQLKALEERADESAEAFNRVSNAVNETKNAIEGLNSSYETIENLTKGTNEWYEAITNANAEVLKLAEKFPELMSNNMIYSDDGLLKITQEGLDFISSTEKNRLQAANDLMINDQIAVQEKEIENSYLNFKNNKGFSINKDLAEGIQNYYQNKNIGDTLFTEAGIKALYDGIKESTIGQYYTEKDFSDLIYQNKDIIQSNADKRENIEALKNSQFEALLASYGLNYSADEGRALLGGQDFSDIVAERRKNIQKEFNADNDWNDSINYNENSAEWDKIQDFMSLKGEDVEYVAQRQGKMVLKVDGEEIEYSEDEVYDTLAELYSGPILEEKLTASLSTTLSNALGGVDLSNATLEDLSSLDNFRKSISDALLNTGNEEQTDSIFKSIIDTYGANEEGIQAFSKDTEFIDFNNIENLRQFNLAVQDLSEGKITIDEFANSLQQMNAMGQLDNMGDFFTSMAEGMGLDEEAAAEMQDYAQHLASIAEDSEELADSLASDANSAADLAVEITRMNKGIEDLAENFEDWNDILENSTESSEEYSKAMNGMKKSLSDVLDVQSDLISDEFVLNNMEQIKEAANGDAEAIDYLRSKMDEEIIARVSLGQTDTVIAEIETLNSKLQEIPTDIEVGAILKDQEFLEAANQLVQTAGMTADEANAYFAGIGYEPVYSVTDVEGTGSQDTNTQTTSYLDNFSLFNGTSSLDLGPFGSYQIPNLNPNITWHTETKKLDPTEIESSIPLVSFSGSGRPKEIKGLRKKATGSMNNYSSANKGGGSPSGKSSGGKKSGGGKSSSPAKPKNYTKKEDVVDRYYEINDALEDISDTLEDTQKKSDRLYGKDKLNEMQKEIDLLKKQNDLLKEKRKQALEYLKIDKQLLTNNKYNIQFTFDEDGDITNYTKIMTDLYNELHKAEQEFNSLTTSEAQSDYQEKVIDPIQNKIDELKSLIDQYNETNDLLMELDNELEDQLNEIQDKNYEKLSYTVEIKVEINDRALEELEFYLDAMSDDFYKMAESAALMKDQYPIFTENLKIYEDAYNNLTKAYENGEISQADYIEGVKEMRENILDNLSSLIELDKEMVHYYEDTLDAAAEELSFFTDQLEHCTSILEHFQNMLGLIGKENDYELLGKILEGQLKTTQNTLKAQKENYEMLLEQKKSLESKLDSAPLGSKEREMIEEEYKAITDAVIEAEEQIYSTTQAIGELAGQILENDLNKAIKELEKGMLEGTGFDKIDDYLEKIDRLNKSQEEYLTTTNAIYETNKLIRKVENDMADTNNLSSKKKYQEYINEVNKYLKDAEEKNVELSQFELDILEAKYEVTKAQIALEDAQNAKDSMRLVRNDSGNWDYVYTANQDRISEAEQALEDANNNLYNITLNGAKDYQSKYAETMQEAVETFKKINENYQNGMYADEQEYNQKMAEAQEYYYGLLKTYKDQYDTALRVSEEENFNIQSDYIFAGIGNLEDFKDATDEYLNDCNESFDNWKDNTQEVTDLVGENLDDSINKIDEVVDHSNNLSDEISNSVIPSIEDELQAVRDMTDEWAAHRDELYKTIEAYIELAKAMSSTISNSVNKDYDPNIDYTALISTYLAYGGGTIGDSIYNELKRQLNNKIQNEEKWQHLGPVDDSIFSNQTSDSFLKDAERYKDSLEEILKQLIPSYDTGGYTGTWGPSGRLGIFHQKEIVLNQDDTINFLKGTQILREIADFLNVSNVKDQILNSVNLGSNMAPEKLTQEVFITAEFPNAVNHSEIEMAFNNLINDATQYVNEKNRQG